MPHPLVAMIFFRNHNDLNNLGKWSPDSFLLNYMYIAFSPLVFDKIFTLFNIDIYKKKKPRPTCDHIFNES